MVYTRIYLVAGGTKKCRTCVHASWTYMYVHVHTCLYFLIAFFQHHISSRLTYAACQTSRMFDLLVKTCSSDTHMCACIRIYTGPTTAMAQPREQYLRGHSHARERARLPSLCSQQRTHVFPASPERILAGRLQSGDAVA